MSDDTTISGGNPPPGGDAGKPAVVIPDEVKKKYPELIPQILASQSMDDEERNYWFSVLPIMTEDQVAELRDILDTEKKRLAALDKKPGEAAPIDLEAMEKKKKENYEKRKQAENASRDEDKDEADDLLNQLDDIL